MRWIDGAWLEKADGVMWNQDDNKNKEFERKKAAFLKILDEEPPFDKAVYDAEIKALEGTMWETATMIEDGTISVKTWDIGAGGTRGDGGHNIRPREESYEECKAKYGLVKPGDSYAATKKLVNGEWVQTAEEWL